MEKKSILLLVLFVVTGVLYYGLTDDKISYNSIEVIRVIDGDTVEINGGEKIRLKGINSPEIGILGSHLAKEFLEIEVLDKSVKVDYFGEDKYGRILGYLLIDGSNVNLEILRRGYATSYYYDEDKYYEEMLAAEEFARLNGIGIWEESKNSECIDLVELDFKEPEKLILKNSCAKKIDVVIKDDATHIYKETLDLGLFEMETSHIWNDAGDSLYVYDSEGLVEFYRY